MVLPSFSRSLRTVFQAADMRDQPTSDFPSGLCSSRRSKNNARSCGDLTCVLTIARRGVSFFFRFRGFSWGRAAPAS